MSEENLINMVDDEESFNVTVDGVEKKANLIDILNINSREFALYSIDTEDGMADIMFSEILKDENGMDYLVDVEETEIKEQIVKAINSMFE